MPDTTSNIENAQAQTEFKALPEFKVAPDSLSPSNLDEAYSRRRDELSEPVRAYADNLHGQITNFLKEKDVENLEQVPSAVRSSQISLDELKHIEALQSALIELLETNQLSTEEIFNIFERRVIRFPIIVNYDQSPEEIVKEGNLTPKGDGLNFQHFPETKKGISHLEALVVGFEKGVKDSELDVKLEAAGLRPGTLKELLALGIQYSRNRLPYSVTATGADWIDSSGHHHNPTLFSAGPIRIGDSIRFGSGWGINWSFLAFRK